MGEAGVTRRIRMLAIGWKSWLEQTMLGKWVVGLDRVVAEKIDD